MLHKAPMTYSYKHLPLPMHLWEELGLHKNCINIISGNPQAKLPKANVPAQRNRTTMGIANSHSHCPNITNSLEAQKLISKAMGLSTSLLASGSWLPLACVMLQQMWVLGSARKKPFYCLCFSCLLSLHNSILGSNTWTMGAEEIVPSGKCLPEMESQNTCKKPGMAEQTWNPSTREVEIDGFLEPVSQLASSNHRIPDSNKRFYPPSKESAYDS